MTRNDFMAAMVRPWYLLLLGGVLTIAALGLLLGRVGVYATQVDVIMLPPTRDSPGNPIEGRSDSLIYFAAIVERELNNGVIENRYASAEATLYGAGVERGYSVTLPNTGGQWQTNFGRPVLSVEVVDADPDRLREVLAEQIGKLSQTVIDVQDREGVAPKDRITIGLSPSEPDISYIGGSRSKIVVGVAILGIGLSVSAVLLVDRWRRGPEVTPVRDPKKRLARTG